MSLLSKRERALARLRAYFPDGRDLADAPPTRREAACPVEQLCLEMDGLPPRPRPRPAPAWNVSLSRPRGKAGVP